MNTQEKNLHNHNTHGKAGIYKVDDVEYLAIGIDDVDDLEGELERIQDLYRRMNASNYEPENDVDCLCLAFVQLWNPKTRDILSCQEKALKTFTQAVRWFYEDHGKVAVPFWAQWVHDFLEITQSTPMVEQLKESLETYALLPDPNGQLSASLSLVYARLENSDKK